MPGHTSGKCAFGDLATRSDREHGISGAGGPIPEPAQFYHDPNKKLGAIITKGRGRQAVRIKRQPKTAAQIAAARVLEKAATIGVPTAQIARGGFVIEDVPLRDAGRVVTLKTLVNRGGTPVARWRAANLLSYSQIAAIDHCERLSEMLGGKAMVTNLAKIPGAGSGDGWAEQETLDDLRRIKTYVPTKYWSIFENVCRFDEAAASAGSALTAYRNDRVAAARITVQFVADIIAMKERLTNA